jgi:hypothetical protein
MATDDETPFVDRKAELSADVTALMVGQVGREAAMGDVQRGFRARVLEWGRSRGFLERDSCLVCEMDGVEITIPIYEVTPETATVSTRTIRAPLGLRLQTEPHGMMSRLTSRFQRDLVRSEDAAFDARYRTVSSDVSLGARLLSQACVDAIQATSTWCRVIYDHGDIAVRVEAERLAGRHLLSAEAVALAFAQADVHATPYR